MARPPSRLLVGLLLAGAVAACSSAPAPTALSQDPEVTPSATSTAGANATTGTGGVPGTTGAATGGTTGGTTGSTSGSTGGTTGSTSGGGTGGTSTTGGSATGGSTGGPVAQLFTAAEDKIGITDTVIRMCAHAALSYGAAFNTDAEDLNVFWTAVNTEKGGVFGRKVEVSYENDDYKPDTAVVAAKACEAKKIFMLLGGIGFDQIPAVRNWAEQSHMLYMHHTATMNGSKGQKYSFSALPSAERMGEGFAQLAKQKYSTKKIAILKRDSANWEPGVDAFKKLAKVYGLKIVAEEKVAQNAGSYAAQLQNFKNAGAEVVWIWLNALETTQVVKQMKAVQFSRNVLVFPFNLTSQTLGSDALSPVMDGVAMYPAYSKGDYSGNFAKYADDLKLFEAQYQKYDPGVDLGGVGGDLLFLNWTAQKAFYELLLDCGKDCTRNRFVGMLQNYHGTPTSSACPIDFRFGDRHHGSTYLTFMQTYQASSAVNWQPTQQCVGPA